MEGLIFGILRYFLVDKVSYDDSLIFFAYFSLWNSRISVSLKRHFPIPAC